jgi:hypothetical protein
MPRTTSHARGLDCSYSCASVLYMATDPYRGKGWRQLNLSVRAEDDQRMRRLARERGLSLSGLLRDLIDRAEEESVRKVLVRQ